jgi:hypothetical protein
MLLIWITVTSEAANEFCLNKLTTEAGIFIISVGYSQKRTNSHDLHLTSPVTVLSESSARLIERHTSWFSGVPCACIRYEISVAWKTGGGRNTKNGSEHEEEEKGKKKEVKGRNKQIKQWMKDSEKWIKGKTLVLHEQPNTNRHASFWVDGCCGKAVWR